MNKFVRFIIAVLLTILGLALLFCLIALFVLSKGLLLVLTIFVILVYIIYGVLNTEWDAK